MSAERIRELLDEASKEPAHWTCPDDWADCNDARATVPFLVAALRVAVPAFEKIVRGDYINDGTPKGQAKRALAAIEKALRGEK
jgi:hypothetical protein